MPPEKPPTHIAIFPNGTEFADDTGEIRTGEQMLRDKIDELGLGSSILVTPTDQERAFHLTAAEPMEVRKLAAVMQGLRTHCDIQEMIIGSPDPTEALEYDQDRKYPETD